MMPMSSTRARVEALAVLLGENGIWRSTDGGDAWQLRGRKPGDRTVARCCGLLADPRDSRTVYAVLHGVGIGGDGDLIRRTIDGGDTWTELSHPGRRPDTHGSANGPGHTARSSDGHHRCRTIRPGFEHHPRRSVDTSRHRFTHELADHERCDRSTAAAAPVRCDRRSGYLPQPRRGRDLAADRNRCAEPVGQDGANCHGLAMAGHTDRLLKH